MTDHLAAYLNNHLSGARVAVDLLGRLRDQHQGTPLAQTAEEVLAEVKEDMAQLEQIIDHVGGSAGRVKAAAAWVGEKMAPIQARLGADEQMGTLEILEALALGVLGKRSLWRALQTLPPGDERLPPVDLEKLIERADAQHARLESLRLATARETLN